MDANVLQDLIKNVGKMDLPKGKPKAVSLEVESIDAQPLEEGGETADPWPMVQEKLAAVKSQVDELESLLSESYYPGEKEELPAGPGPGLGPVPGPEMRPY
tara:strand:- start:202 stop:504 length:303 start_codon:yes stop_codon:yes gene_type:complete